MRFAALFWLASTALVHAQTAWQSLSAAAHEASTGTGFEVQSQQAGAAFTGGTSATAPSAVKTQGGASFNPSLPPKKAEKGNAGPPPPPSLSEMDRAQLEALRAGGLTAAAGGLALFGLAAAGKLGWAAGLGFAGAGPIGMAAALVFFGGMAAYWSHNKLQGKDIFK